MPEIDRTAEVRQTWGDQLRIERHIRKLKQAEVAAKAGVSQTAVSDAERGLGLGAILRIAAALDVTLVAEPPAESPAAVA